MTYYKLGEAAFRPWFNNFVTTATAGGNIGVLGLSPADVTSFNNTRTSYQNAVAAQVTARDAAEAATITKNNAYKSAYDLVQLWAAVWQADPAVTAELKQQLGLVVRDTNPSPRPLYPATEMTGTGNGVGTVKLRWNSNGNLAGVTYLVQSRPVGGTWSLLTATSRTRVALGGQPIEPTEFRVVAERRGQVSEPSYAIVVYGEGSSFLSLEQAA
ncbi:MAG: hypothetical protein AB7F50_10710 [Fimbriimonadaceae bacterium]